LARSALGKLEMPWGATIARGGAPDPLITLAGDHSAGCSRHHPLTCPLKLPECCRPREYPTLGQVIHPLRAALTIPPPQCPSHDSAFPTLSPCEHDLARHLLAFKRPLLRQYQNAPSAPLSLAARLNTGLSANIGYPGPVRSSGRLFVSEAKGAWKPSPASPVSTL